MLVPFRCRGGQSMDANVQWLLAALGAALVPVLAWLGYRAFRRAARVREAAGHAAEAAARAAALRRAGAAAARQAAAAESATREQALAGRAAAQAAAREAERQVIQQAAAAAAEVARAQAAANATAHVAAQAAAEAAARAAALATERAAAESEAQAQVRHLAALAALQLEARQQAAARAHAEAARLAPPAEAALPKSPDQTLVMVADDSKVVRVKTGRLLAQHRYRVAYAVDGLDAARQMQDSVPDVMITDVEMPGMDGFELTRHVRQNPLTAHIPIIMITAADDKHRDDAQRAGVTVLLGKPYPEAALIEHIRVAMAERNASNGTSAGTLAQCSDQKQS